MEKHARLLKRAGDLKAELGEFAMGSRFRGELGAYVEERLGEYADETSVNTLIDTFVLQVPLKGGGTVVERFAASRRGLTEEERGLLRSWTDPVQGVFDIVERTGDGGVVGLNLLNELTYVIRSNMGAAGLVMLDPGVLFAGRIVPFKEDWMITGPAVSYRGPAEKAAIRTQLPQLMLDNPREVFRNPEKLAAGRAMQEEQRQAFLDLYGDDVLVVPGSEVPERALAVYRRVQEKHGVTDAAPAPMPFPAEWEDAESVALIFDSVDGLGFYVDYDLARRAFADPALIVRREHREVVTAYLREEPGPVPILRLVRDADPGDVDRLFQRMLDKPGFRWERDGQALLHRYKAAWYDDPPLPRTVPFSASSARAPHPPKADEPGPSPLQSLDDVAGGTATLSRLAAFVGWLGTGRKLTQKHHLNLRDAGELVELLQTGDVIDPEVGGKAWKTKSSAELGGLTKIVGMAKAVRLVRVTGGRLVPVKKNAGLLDHPGELLGAIVSVLPGLAEALLPSRWASIVTDEFESIVPTVLSRLYRASGPILLDELSETAWVTATEAYWLDDLPAEQLDIQRRLGRRDVAQLVETLRDLGIVAEDAGPEPSRVVLSELGREVLSRLRGAPLPGEPVHQVKITLVDSADPVIWRRVLVPAAVTLDRLHLIIQSAMGWEDCHLHSFTTPDGTIYSVPGLPDLPFMDETGVSLADAGGALSYEYDFGDGWAHSIEIEETFPADAMTVYPACVAGEGACPPEDCGGIPGYFHLREALADSDSPEREHYLELLGLESATDFDAHAFDVTTVNGLLP